jgi:hypothetical protein
MGKDQGCQTFTTKLDSEDPVNGQLSSINLDGNGETIYQKLLWERTGLFNTFHVLSIQCEQSDFKIDFLRYGFRFPSVTFIFPSC